MSFTPATAKPRRTARRKPDASNAGLQLDSFLPYRLSVLSGRVSRSLSRVYADRFGLSIPEWRIIANLGRMGPLGAGALADRSSLDKPKLTRALQRLEARGLIKRATVAEDRRRATLALTRQGGRIYRAIEPAALEWQTRLLEALSEVERAALLEMFGRLERQLATLD